MPSFVRFAASPGAAAGGDAARSRNQALHGGKPISKASYERMVAPEGPAKAHHDGFGFGIGSAKLRDHVMRSHGGGIHGFASTPNYLPASQTAVVILRNSTGPGRAPLVPLGQGRFAFPDSLNELPLERGADGKAVALRACASRRISSQA